MRHSGILHENCSVSYYYFTIIGDLINHSPATISMGSSGNDVSLLVTGAMQPLHEVSYEDPITRRPQQCWVVNPEVTSNGSQDIHVMRFLKFD